MPNFRIPQLSEIPTLSDDDQLAIYDKSSGKTRRVDVSRIKTESTSNSSLQWSSTETYDTPATASGSGNPTYAEYNGKLWKTLTDNNLNNIPQEGANWTEVSKSEPGLNNWVAGTFVSDPTFVIGSLYGRKYLLYLLSSTPFESSDLEAEFENNDWEVIGSFQDNKVVEKTSGFTLAANDRGKTFECDGTFQINIPVNGLPADWNCTIVNVGTGTITVGAAIGVTLDGKGTSLTEQWGAATLYNKTETVFRLIGDIT